MRANPFSKNAVELSRLAGEKEAREYEDIHADPFSDIGVLRAKRKQRYESEDFILRETERIGYDDEEYRQATDDIMNSPHIVEKNKIGILSDMYHYYIEGDEENAYRVHDKLFNLQGNETFVPSDVGF